MSPWSQEVSGWESKEVLIIAIIGINVAYLINLPVVIYCAYKFYKSWNKPYIVKRRKSIILSIIILLCWGTLIEYPYYLAEYLADIQVSHVFVNTMSLIGFASRCLLAALISLRIYLLHYDHQYNRVLSTQKWQILIDPSLENNFYLLNRQKYGNHTYIIKFILIPIFVVYFGTYLVFDLTQKEDLYFNLSFSTFCFAICTISGYYYWRSFPNKIHDSLFIRDELKFSIKMYALIVITIVIGTICLLLVDRHIPFALMLISVTVIETVIIYIMILYPERKLKDDKDLQVSKQIANTSKSSRLSTKYVCWEKIIETDDGYEQFANFLEKEFSCENILFITEYVEFKNAMIENSGLQEIISNQLELSYTLKLPESAPISLISKTFLQEMRIMEENNETNTDDIILRALKKLYLKYIDPSKAILEVNISSGIRSQLMNIFKSMESKPLNDKSSPVLQHVLPLVESAVLEISYLINDSCYRFRRTDVFIELIQQN